MYAEVQNVKVSGDIAARYIIRANYDLDKNETAGATSSSGGLDNTDDYLQSSAEVQVDADLTDNVATCVRLVNQRTWNDVRNEEASLTPTAALNSSVNQFDVLVDLANVTFKEFFYAPLTVTMGRQDLWFGKGFVVGAKQRDPKNTISADEYTVINSFDAIKGTLDFDPWKVDAVYSIIEENDVSQADDIWLAGVNVGYKFNSYNGEAEAYAWHKHDRSNIAYVDGTTTVPTGINWIGTYGIRGSLEPIANATLAAEGALQLGRYSITTTQGATRRRKAAAMDLSGDYLFKDTKWTPKVGLEYIAYSGEEADAATDTNTYEGWDPIYRGKFDTAIREFQNIYYTTAHRTLNNTATALDSDSGVTNEQQVALVGQVKPTSNLTVDGRFTWFRYFNAPAPPSGATSRSKEIGSELDLTLTYDYTEDVSFNLLAAWFFPGKYWIAGQDDNATDIVGTVKVAF
ncbi:MAG: alginate export family protein [Candidatus Omnitrophica bacterium]|nr:alginate export family protein [Candidatus Omnitrophota bacterium]